MGTMNESIAVTAEPAAPRPVVVLLKSVQIAHQAGYYLLNGRWHKHHQDKPAPKGVPVVADKPASGHTRMTGEMWAQVYAHADNSNKATFVKKLDKLKEAYQAGDVHAILAGSYPNDTTNKKVAKVANYLLGLMGSEHTVEPGLKLGTHHALNGAPDAPKPVETPAPVAEVPPVAPEAPVSAPAPEPTTEPQVAPVVASEAPAGGLPMPEFIEGKSTIGVISYYEDVAAELQALHAAGDVAGLEKMKADGLTPNKNGKIGNTWKGKTENSKMLLAMQADAVAKLGGAPDPVEQPQVVEPSGIPLMEQATIEKLNDWAAAGKHEDIQKFASSEVAKGFPDALLHALDLLQQSAAIKAGNGKPVKPETASAHWNEVTSTVENAMRAGDIAEVQKVVDTTSGLISQPAIKAHEYAKAALAHMTSEALAAAPVKPTDITGHYAIADKVEQALTDKDIAALDEVIYLSDESPPETNMGKVGSYAVAAKAYLESQPAAPESSASPEQNATGAPAELIATIAATKKEAQANQYAFDYLKDNGTTPETVDHVIEALNHSGYQGLVDQFKAAKAKAADMNATLPGVAELGIAVSKSGNTNEAMNHAVNFILKNGDTPQAYAAAVLAMQAEGFHTAAKSLEQSKPKEGDTKPGADGLLVLKNGHWVKADQGAAVAEPDVAADVHPLDAVPMPGLSDLNKPAVALANLELLKQMIKDQGPSALKGVTKKMKATGKLISVLPTMSGGTQKIVGYVGNGGSHVEIYDYIESLKQVASGKSMPKAKPQPAAAKAQAPASPAIPAMDAWEKIGPQAGSNPGGKFVDGNGDVWYCKFPKDENIAKSEVLAAKLYEAAGVAGQDAQLVTKDGKIGIASKWVDVSQASPAQLAKAKGAKAGFAVDAWLANHDVVGLNFDNLQLAANGNAVRVDAGGSLEYRAQGAKKDFGDTVTEIDTLRDKSINDKSAAVFGKMTKADITASVANVLKVSTSQIYALVNTYGPGTAEDKAKLAATLIARKADLLAKYPKAKKEKKVTFKPEDISAPPSFTNWGGGGSSGPSSKEFINLANEKAVQSIYTAAQTGDPEKVKALSAETYNKATGEVTGVSPVLEHPSQHVKGYAQQAMNEIHQQLNPPKVFRFDGGHPLHSLNDAYPALNGAKHGESVEKAGKFMVLGSPGTIDLAALGLDPSSWANGKLTQATYSPAASSIIKAMPVTQKQAIVSYTGAGYHAINSSLWSGNPSGASKSAAEALNTLGHEITPGTILSRKLSLSGVGLDQILASTGKILQEPAIMSTSIRPSSWSGNTQLKLHVGPGVKGLWVGKGSSGGSGGLSQHQGEDEMILPPNTRILVMSVKKVSGADADGFGNGINHVIEAVILPSEQPAK